jgi:hypothetical protein
MIASTFPISRRLFKKPGQVLKGNDRAVRGSKANQSQTDLACGLLRTAAENSPN